MMSELESGLAALAATLRTSTVAVRSGGGAGSGSGVVWSADGSIITNAHVARTRRVEIELPGGLRLPGTVERRDEERDLASIRVGATRLTTLALRSLSDLRPGEFVVAFGHPLGVPNVLSAGIIYGPHRPGADRFVRSDVKLAPGNSGGALADVAGRLIGINSMVAGNMALAIPVDDVRRFMGEALPLRRLGVRLAPAHFPDRRSAYAVMAIEPGSCAERAGIMPGDIILTRDPARLAGAPSLSVLRGGSVIAVGLPPDRSEAAAAA